MNNPDQTVFKVPQLLIEGGEEDQETIPVADWTQWKLKHAVWNTDRSHLKANDEGIFKHLLESPYFVLKAGKNYSFRITAEIPGDGGISIGLWQKGNWFKSFRHDIHGNGMVSSFFQYTPQQTASYQIKLINFRTDQDHPTRIQNLEVQISGRDFEDPSLKKDLDTFLPHWNAWQRRIHSLCRRSKFWNMVVSGIEMRLNREEVLSLPQYMGLCPTGQCQALCGFCSVTINRTGIIKKQLPFDKLNKFLSPISRTIQMYGLEGNGEPTLYDQFDDLIKIMSKDGAQIYLITNGERLTADQIKLLLERSVESVNFSVNGFTAESHAEVMKLKHFDQVIGNIRTLMEGRVPGKQPQPTVGISFVVVQDNIHEVQDFLHFAEWDLKVDRIYIRPLSELANTAGAIEDPRNLVPYESDVRDMLDSARDYLEFVSRRAEIHLLPETFRSIRPDPFGRIILPKGFEDRLLAPRRYYWDKLVPQLELQWNLKTVKISCPPDVAAGDLLTSVPIPVEPNKKLTFQCQVQISGGPACLAVVDPAGRQLTSQILKPKFLGSPLEVRFQIKTGGAEWVKFVLSHEGKEFTAEFKFDRLRTPSQDPTTEFKLPSPKRWQVDSPGANMEWRDTQLNLKWNGKPGPYLVKSYSAPCPIHTRLSLPIQVDVHQGKLVIGVLDQSGESWVKQFPFSEGRHSEEIEIETGENRNLRFVLFSQSETPLDASIDWKETIKAPDNTTTAGIESESISDDAQKDFQSWLKLPKPEQWQIDSPEASVIWNGPQVQVAWNGNKGLYITSTLYLPCARHSRLNLPFELEVHKGKLGIGVLNEDGSNWISQQIFKKGTYSENLVINAGDNEKVRVVLSTQDESPIKATVLWKQDLNPDQSPPSEDTESASNLNAVPKKQNSNTGSIWQNLFSRPQSEELKYYCNKPWSDMNNYTVDGRIDVCCIATGASQEYYQLGNLIEQDFQEVWNGERAREFRRTVNTPEKLPPCQRCPMAYQYQGPLFDPKNSRDWLWSELLYNLGIGTVPRFSTNVIHKGLTWMVENILFRGFKRNP